jgi:hypothetical protein
METNSTKEKGVYTKSGLKGVKGKNITVVGYGNSWGGGQITSPMIFNKYKCK